MWRLEELVLLFARNDLFFSVMLARLLGIFQQLLRVRVYEYVSSNLVAFYVYRLLVYDVTDDRYVFFN